MNKYNITHKGITCTDVDWETDTFYLEYKGIKYIYKSLGKVSCCADTDHIRCIIEESIPALLELGWEAFANEMRQETARKILKRIADECIIGIDSNLKCMADQKDTNTLWHNCLGKKTACQGIYDVVIELQEEYGLEREETE